MEETIRRSVKQSQEEICKVQAQNGDHSSSSITSLIFSSGLLYAANLGPSVVICQTTSRRLLTLAKPHNTHNEAEVERIIQ